MVVYDQSSEGFTAKGEPEGKMVDGAYLHEGSDKSRAIIFLTDIFGLPLVNCKVMADQYSKKLDCDVWVPDMFAGRPPMQAEQLEPLLPDRAGVKTSFMTSIRLMFIFFSRLHLRLASRDSVVDSRIENFIRKLQAENNYPKLGAVGYSHGGAAAIRLGSKNLVNSLVIAHPAMIRQSKIRAINVPCSWECAEDDRMFGTKARIEAEAVFVARKGKPDFVDYEFKYYKGTAHGFAARPNMALPEIAKAFNDAFAQSIAWFEKTLQV